MFEAGNVKVEVYNVMGQFVRTLVKNRDQIGQFVVQWNGQNEIGQDIKNFVLGVNFLTYFSHSLNEYCITFLPLIGEKIYPNLSYNKVK